MTQKPYPLGQQIWYGLFPYLQPRLHPEGGGGGGGGGGFGFAKGTHFVHFQKDMSVGFEIFRMHQSVSSGL